MLTFAVHGNHVHRLITAALLLLAVLGMALLSPNKADARGVWCSGDPTIIVNGSAVSITAHLPMDRLADVEYVEFVFHVPANAIVGAVVNDSLLFPARITVKKDLPADYKLGTPVTVDMRVRHKGKSFPDAATALATGGGSRIWVDGTSTTWLMIKTWGLL